MITMSQISSHTIVAVYRPLQDSSGHGGLQFSTHQLTPLGVVLRELERRPCIVRVDSASGRNAHG
jgi:hypothetical protein